MATDRNPIFDSIRIIPREQAFLDRKLGSRGEIFFDREDNALRIFDGVETGGYALLRADLENLEGVLGAALSDTPPLAPQPGSIWFNTSNGKLYVYYGDGDSAQWVQPTTPSYGGGSVGGGGSGSGTVASGVLGKLAYYSGNGTTVDDLTEVSWASSTLTVTGSINVSGQKNYIRHHWDTLNDLINEADPVVWHGMIAHVHETGRVYFAHSGAWTPLANQSDLGSGITNILAGNNVTVSNNNGVFTINAVVGSGGGGISLEDAQDGTASLFQNGTHTGISFAYNDSGNAISATVQDIALGSRTTGAYVASVATSSGLTGGAVGSETAILTLGIDSTVVALLSAAQTLTNKTISGGNNTLTNIGNSSLTNSSITINGTAVSLGGSITVASGGASTLDSLTDVVITSASTGQVLKYDGTNWINGTDNTASEGSASDSFATIAVAGQSSVVADSATDTLTLVGAGGITITTNATTDTITITGSGGSASDSFATIAVAGQSSVVADSSTDTLTLVAGTGISITTNASTDTVTINSTVSAGVTAFTGLTDAAGLTVDQFYLPAITRLAVTANGSSAYRFDQYSTADNPTIYAISGTTIAFDLSSVSTHPFLIRFSGSNYNTGLVHVTTSGTVTTGTNAQGKTNGTLYWKIPAGISGTYGYLCGSHGGMVGTITIKDIATI